MRFCKSASCTTVFVLAARCGKSNEPRLTLDGASRSCVLVTKAGLAYPKQAIRALSSAEQSLGGGGGGGAVLDRGRMASPIWLPLPDTLYSTSEVRMSELAIHERKPDI